MLESLFSSLRQSFLSLRPTLGQGPVSPDWKISQSSLVVVSWSAPVSLEGFEWWFRQLHWPPSNYLITRQQFEDWGWWLWFCGSCQSFFCLLCYHPLACRCGASTTTDCRVGIEGMCCCCTSSLGSILICADVPLRMYSLSHSLTVCCDSGVGLSLSDVAMIVVKVAMTVRWNTPHLTTCCALSSAAWSAFFIDVTFPSDTCTWSQWYTHTPTALLHTQ